MGSSIEIVGIRRRIELRQPESAVQRGWEGEGHLRNRIWGGGAQGE